MVSISKTLGKFQYNNCWKNLWKFLGTFLLVHYFQNMIGWAPFTQGYNYISYWAQIHIFVVVIFILGIAKLVKLPK